MEHFEELYKSKQITNFEYARNVYGEIVFNKNFGMGIVYNALGLNEERYYKSTELYTLTDLCKKFSIELGAKEINRLLMAKGIIKEIYATPTSKTPRKIANNPRYCKNVSGKSFPLFYESNFLELMDEITK